MHGWLLVVAGPVLLLQLRRSGGVAQMGERVVRNDEVGSSILLLSTIPTEKTYGGRFALVSRSYQAQTGNVRPGKPPPAGVRVLPS